MKKKVQTSEELVMEASKTHGDVQEVPITRNKGVVEEEPSLSEMIITMSDVEYRTYVVDMLHRIMIRLDLVAKNEDHVNGSKL